MHKRLLCIYLILILPIAVLNFTKILKIKKLKKKQTELLFLESRIDSFASIEKANQKVRKKFKSFNPEYLYTFLEQLPLTNNAIQMIETSSEKTPFYIEKKESLANSVEADLSEIKTILERVEGDETPQKPHLTFTEFSLKKNKHPENITYHLNFKLTKREYLN